MSGGCRTHDRCPMAPRGCGRRSRRPQGVGSSGVKCIPRKIGSTARACVWPKSWHCRAKTSTAGGWSFRCAALLVAAPAPRRSLWTGSSFCGASCCMYCREALSASAPSVCSLIGIARRRRQSVANGAPMLRSPLPRCSATNSNGPSSGVALAATVACCESSHGSRPRSCFSVHPICFPWLPSTPHETH